MKKTIIFSLALCAFNASSRAVYAPPQSHVLAAAIELVQGDSIYANGNMQSQLRVRYTLRDGITVENIRLKEFGTGQELSQLGWIASDIDNGFDHNIGEVRSAHQLAHSHMDMPDDKNYRNFFVSTKNSNQNIVICYELTTKKVSNGQTSVFSSCDQEGLIHGTVKVFAERPHYYYAADFMLEKVEQFVKVSKDMDAYLYSIRPQYTIPRNMHFRVKEDALFAPADFLDNSSKALLSYPIKTSNSDAPQDQVTQTTTWLLRPNKDTKAKVLTFNPNLLVNTISLADFYGAIAYFFHTQYQHNSVLAGDWRCEVKQNASKQVSCTFPAYPEPTYAYLGFKSWYEVQARLRTEKSKVITLIDNYGTEHNITLHSGFGGESKDIFIS